MFIASICINILIKHVIIFNLTLFLLKHIVSLKLRPPMASPAQWVAEYALPKATPHARTDYQLQPPLGKGQAWPVRVGYGMGDCGVSGRRRH